MTEPENLPAGSEGISVKLIIMKNGKTIAEAPMSLLRPNTWPADLETRGDE